MTLALLLSMLAMFASYLSWFWIRDRILRHLREHHPVVGAAFVVPPPTILRNDLERLTDDVHVRLNQFIRSGGATALRDPALDRLLSLRRAVPWAIGVCAIAFVVSGYLSRTA